MRGNPPRVGLAMGRPEAAQITRSPRRSSSLTYVRREGGPSVSRCFSRIAVSIWLIMHRRCPRPEMALAPPCGGRLARGFATESRPS